MNPTDLQHLRTAIELARQAREHGNHPFGALLVDKDNKVLLQAENTVVTGRDCTGHAETNLMRLASRHYSAEELEILYALYQHRTVRDVRGSDPLGQCKARCICFK